MENDTKIVVLYSSVGDNYFAAAQPTTENNTMSFMLEWRSMPQLEINELLVDRRRLYKHKACRPRISRLIAMYGPSTLAVHTRTVFLLRQETIHTSFRPQRLQTYHVTLAI